MMGNEKLDKHYDLLSNGTLIEDFPFWKKNVPGHNFNGYTFPQAKVAIKEGWNWQVYTFH